MDHSHESRKLGKDLQKIASQARPRSDIPKSVRRAARLSGSVTIALSILFAVVVGAAIVTGARELGETDLQPPAGDRGTGERGAEAPNEIVKLAYIRHEIPDEPKSNDIYLMNEDGTELQNLTQNPANDFGPAWSPDGNRIAFSSDRGHGDMDLYVMNDDGTRLRRFGAIEGDDYRPDWSANDQQMAFIHGDDQADGGDVYVMNANGTDATALLKTPENETSVTWSPDGDRVAFANETGVYVVNSDGAGVKHVFACGTGELITTVDWSPDGASLIFDIVAEDGSTHQEGIFTVSPTGGPVKQIVGMSGARSPAWSYDGSRIAFNQVVKQQGVLTSQILVANADGGGVTMIGGGEMSFDPVWQPVPDAP